jgi:hypothetical protein
MSLPPPDKRKSDRIQPFVVRCRVLVEGRAALSAYVTNLSTGGAQIWSEHEPPAAGTRLVLEIAFGRGMKRARLHGELKWCRPPADAGSRHVFGVGFTGATDAEHAALETALAEFRRRAALLS